MVSLTKNDANDANDANESVSSLSLKKFNSLFFNTENHGSIYAINRILKRKNERFAFMLDDNEGAGNIVNQYFIPFFPPFSMSYLRDNEKIGYYKVPSIGGRKEIQGDICFVIKKEFEHEILEPLKDIGLYLIEALYSLLYVFVIGIKYVGLVIVNHLADTQDEQDDSYENEKYQALCALQDSSKNFVNCTVSLILTALDFAASLTMRTIISSLLLAGLIIAGVGIGIFFIPCAIDAMGTNNVFCEATPPGLDPGRYAPGYGNRF